MNDPADMIGPFTRPVVRDPALWITVGIVTAATIATALRAWSESASVTNVVLLAAMTFVLTTLTTLFVVSVVVGVPRGWRLGRRRDPPG